MTSLFVLTLGSLLGSPPAPVDTGFGIVSGRVVDAEGARLATAEIVLSSARGSFTRTTSTDGDGTFQFDSVPAGDGYVVAVRRIGFRPLTRSALTVPRNQQLWVEVTLVPAAMVLPEIVVRSDARGDLAGKLIPPGDFGLYAAEVELRDSNGGFSKTVLAWSKGKFRFKSVPAAGTYTLTVRTLGYWPVRMTGLSIPADGERTIEIPLIYGGTILPADTSRAGKPVWSFVTRADIEKRPTANALTVVRLLRVGTPINLMCPRAREKVFVNGERIDVPGKPVREVLEWIPAEEIEELRFVHCNDFDVPMPMRNSWWIRTGEKVAKATKKDTEQNAM